MDYVLDKTLTSKRKLKFSTDKDTFSVTTIKEVSRSCSLTPGK